MSGETEDYKMIKLVGKGTYGAVYMALRKADDQLVVIKMIADSRELRNNPGFEKAFVLFKTEMGSTEKI